jgi:hypothetical protein
LYGDRRALVRSGHWLSAAPGNFTFIANLPADPPS